MNSRVRGQILVLPYYVIFMRSRSQLTQGAITVGVYEASIGFKYFRDIYHIDDHKLDLGQTSQILLLPLFMVVVS